MLITSYPAHIRYMTTLPAGTITTKQEISRFLPVQSSMTGCWSVSAPSAAAETDWDPEHHVSGSDFLVDSDQSRWVLIIIHLKYKLYVLCLLVPAEHQGDRAKEREKEKHGEFILLFLIHDKPEPVWSGDELLPVLFTGEKVSACSFRTSAETSACVLNSRRRSCGPAGFSPSNQYLTYNNLSVVSF